MRALLILMTASLALAVPMTAVAEPIPNDISVTFTVCMSGEMPNGSLCVIGNAAEIGSWNTGVTMTDLGSELWEVTVVFNQGTDNAVLYKYKRADCSDWESTGDRPLTLPLDGTTAVTLEPDSWNQIEPIGCGFSEALEEDVTICFQVCMESVVSTGANCVIGSRPEIGEWGTGLTLRDLGSEVYQKCVTFLAGQLVPLKIEYKFQKDDCATWESLPGGPFDNRTVTLDNGSPAVFTVTSVWDDGGGTCSTVGAVPTSWSAVKAQFDN